MGNDPVNNIDPGGTTQSPANVCAVSICGSIDDSVNIVATGGGGPTSTLPHDLFNSVFEIDNPSDENTGQGSGQDLPHPICITTAYLLARKDVIEAMDKAFAMAKAINEEYGGWVFWNKDTNQIEVIIGDKGITNRRSGIKQWEGEWQLLKRYETFKKEGKNSMVLLIDFHTHLYGSEASAIDTASLRGLRRRPRYLGLIVHGPGNYSVYTAKLYEKPTPELLAECLPFQR